MKRVLFALTLVIVTVRPAFPAQSQSADKAQAGTPLTVDAIIMEEYKALRSEIVQCLQSRVTILALGFPAVGALVAAGLAFLTRRKPYWIPSALIIGLGVTMTSLYIVDLWSEETFRMARASYHNCFLESKLDSLFPGKVAPLEWEHKVRMDETYKSIMPPTDTGTPMIFLWLSVGSGLGGLLLFWAGTNGFKNPCLLLPTALVGVSLLFGVVHPRLKELQRVDQVWKITSC